MTSPVWPRLRSSPKPTTSSSLAILFLLFLASSSAVFAQSLVCLAGSDGLQSFSGCIPIPANAGTTGQPVLDVFSELNFIDPYPDYNASVASTSDMTIFCYHLRAPSSHQWNCLNSSTAVRTFLRTPPLLPIGTITASKIVILSDGYGEWLITGLCSAFDAANAPDFDLDSFRNLPWPFGEQQPESFALCGFSSPTLHVAYLVAPSSSGIYSFTADSVQKGVAAMSRVSFSSSPPTAPLFSCALVGDRIMAAALRPGAPLSNISAFGFATSSRTTVPEFTTLMSTPLGADGANLLLAPNPNDSGLASALFSWRMIDSEYSVSTLNSTQVIPPVMTASDGSATIDSLPERRLLASNNGVYGAALRCNVSLCRFRSFKINATAVSYLVNPPLSLPLLQGADPSTLRADLHNDGTVHVVYIASNSTGKDCVIRSWYTVTNGIQIAFHTTNLPTAPPLRSRILDFQLSQAPSASTCAAVGGADRLLCWSGSRDLILDASLSRNSSAIYDVKLRVGALPPTFAVADTPPLAAPTPSAAPSPSSTPSSSPSPSSTPAPVPVQASPAPSFPSPSPSSSPSALSLDCTAAGSSCLVTGNASIPFGSPAAAINIPTTVTGSLSVSADANVTSTLAVGGNLTLSTAATLIVWPTRTDSAPVSVNGCLELAGRLTLVIPPSTPAGSQSVPVVTYSCVTGNLSSLDVVDSKKESCRHLTEQRAIYGTNQLSVAFSLSDTCGQVGEQAGFIPGLSFAASLAVAIAVPLVLILIIVAAILLANPTTRKKLFPYRDRQRVYEMKGVANKRIERV